jgi:hypothetical protein
MYSMAPNNGLEFYIPVITDRFSLNVVKDLPLYVV